MGGWCLVGWDFCCFISDSIAFFGKMTFSLSQHLNVITGTHSSICVPTCCVFHRKCSDRTMPLFSSVVFVIRTFDISTA